MSEIEDSTKKASKRSFDVAFLSQFDPNNDKTASEIESPPSISHKRVILSAPKSAFTKVIQKNKSFSSVGPSLGHGGSATTTSPMGFREESVR